VGQHVWASALALPQLARHAFVQLVPIPTAKLGRVLTLRSAARFSPKRATTTMHALPTTLATLHLAIACMLRPLCAATVSANDLFSSF
jgi:hypothetical protein